MKTDQLSIEETLSEAVLHVFSTMASVALSRLPSLVLTRAADSNMRTFIGSISFAGEASGVIHIMLPEQLANQVSAGILGFSREDIKDSDISDVISELTNMVGGKIKSVLSDNGSQCVLSLPTVVKGHAIEIQTELQGGSRYFTAFRHENSVIEVELALKI